MARKATVMEDPNDPIDLQLTPEESDRLAKMADRSADPTGQAYFDALRASIARTQESGARPVSS